MAGICKSYDLTKIIVLQKFFVKHSFKSYLKKNIDIFDKLNSFINIEKNENLFNNSISNFDNLTKFIMKKYIMNEIKVLLDKYYRMVSFNSKGDIISFQLTQRIFLSMYVIYGYPEIILSNKREKILSKEVDNFDYDIYVLSENLYIKLNKLINNYSLENNRQFVKAINMYSNCFLIWKNKDKMKKIKSLVNEWSSFQETIDEVKSSESYDTEQKENTINELRNSQVKIFELIKKFKVNIDINYLKNHYSLYNQIKSNYEKSYWDLLINDLNNEKYDFLKKILNEIQNNMIRLRKNNSNFVNQFKENYDVNFIIQMIENKVFTPDNLLSYSNYLIDLILKFEAPIRNNNTNDKWNKIINNFKNFKIEDFNKNIAIILKFILNKINEINDDIFNLYILNNL